MALRDGNWQIRLQLDGRLLESSTDDLTLAQMDVAERVSGIPWALWDPRRSARLATALFVVLLMADGIAEDVAVKQAQELPGSVLKGAFSWVPPVDPLPTPQNGPTDPPA